MCSSNSQYVVSYHTCLTSRGARAPATISDAPSFVSPSLYPEPTKALPPACLGLPESDPEATSSAPCLQY